MMPVRQMKRIDRLLKGWRESEAGEGSRVFFRSRRKNREKAIISIMATDHCWTVPKASGVKIRREIRPFSRVLSMKLIILITPHPNPLPKHPHPKKGGTAPDYLLPARGPERSEERRVEEEWRSRWW